jgi:hypothetical protein
MTQGVVVLLLGDGFDPCDIPLTLAEVGEQGDDHDGGEDRVQDDEGSADRIHAFASAAMGGGEELGTGPGESAALAAAGRRAMTGASER